MAYIRKQDARTGTLAAAWAAALMIAVFVSTPGLAATAPDCSKTVYDYAFYRDGLDTAGYRLLFTQDAVISFAGRTYSGLDAIVAELEALRIAARPTATRHVMSNVRIGSLGAPLKGTAYLTLYSGPRSTSGTSPIPLSGPTVVGVYDIEFRLAAGRCLIARSNLAIDFVRAPAAPAPG